MRTNMAIFESGWHACDGIILTVRVDGEPYLTQKINKKAVHQCNSVGYPKLRYKAHEAFYIHAQKFGDVKFTADTLNKAEIIEGCFCFYTDALDYHFTEVHEVYVSLGFIGEVRHAPANVE